MIQEQEIEYLKSIGVQIVKAVNHNLKNCKRCKEEYFNPNSQYCRACLIGAKNGVIILYPTKEEAQERKLKLKAQQKAAKEINAKLRQFLTMVNKEEIGDRLCKECGININHKRRQAKYCSKKCSDKKYNNTIREKPLKKLPKDRICENCGNPIPKNADVKKKNCSEKCAQNASSRRYYDRMRKHDPERYKQTLAKRRGYMAKYREERNARLSKTN